MTAKRQCASGPSATSIPLDALKQFPEVHAKLVGQLPQSAMVDVKVNWRCKCHPHLGGGGTGFGRLPSLRQAALLPRVHPATSTMEVTLLAVRRG